MTDRLPRYGSLIGTILDMDSPLQRDIKWLDARLEEVAPPGTRVDLDELRTTVQTMLASGTPAEALRSINLDRIRAMLKILTIRFHLRNKAEQVHIARVNRQREREATTQVPRPESLRAAVAALAADCPLPRLLEILLALDIRPTLTAHPTESRRRSILEKQRRIGDMLAINDSTDSTTAERERAASHVRQALSLLLVTDEVRSRRLEVIDEVRNGIRYLAGTIWDAIPALYHDLSDAIQAYYGQTIDLPVVLRYRSWIGGDRDGNPNVTATRTQQALAEMRRVAIRRHTEALEQLEREFSVSNRRVQVGDRLLQSIRQNEQEQPLDQSLVQHFQHEPFRVKIRHMKSRLDTPGYTATRFVDDLVLLQNAVLAAGLNEVATRGLLADAIIRARTFGFHLAALDIRQNARVHEAAIAEMLSAAGVATGYESMDENARREILLRELQNPGPLVPPGKTLSNETRELLETLTVTAKALHDDPDSIGSYIVSMANDVSDVLEPLLLLREVGLWRMDSGVVQSPFDIAPLFETVDDLSGASRVMADLLKEPAYAAHLVARGNLQEIMLGYSDSNKDGGYWAANWRLYRAEDELARTCADADVSVRFFHGRGGTVARGGGRAHRAILSSPPSSGNGRIRFTEQGEVISFRYATPALAHRHLEQIINAMLRRTADTRAKTDSRDELAPLMDAMADHSRSTYRQLIDDPDFWPWFIECSPMRHIGELPIASRPALRVGSEVKFENLRAIPWVFAWTQMRYVVPGWYGFGSAFETIVINDKSALDSCRTGYRAGGHFRAIIDNAQQEMARARLQVGRWYAGESQRDIHDRIAAEFARAERAVLAVTGQDALLDNNPVIQRSILERNPDTDLINALQVELLRRWRDATDDNRPQLAEVILLSVNALAAAMQSTG